MSTTRYIARQRKKQTGQPHPGTSTHYISTVLLMCVGVDSGSASPSGGRNLEVLWALSPVRLPRWPLTPRPSSDPESPAVVSCRQGGCGYGTGDLRNACPGYLVGKGGRKNGKSGMKAKQGWKHMTIVRYQSSNIQGHNSYKMLTDPLTRWIQTLASFYIMPTNFPSQFLEVLLCLLQFLDIGCVLMSLLLQRLLLLLYHLLIAT